MVVVGAAVVVVVVAVVVGGAVVVVVGAASRVVVVDCGCPESQSSSTPRTIKTTPTRVNTNPMSLRLTVSTAPVGNEPQTPEGPEPSAP